MGGGDEDASGLPQRQRYRGCVGPAFVVQPVVQQGRDGGDRPAEWWSTINSGNVIDLDGVAAALAIKPEYNDFEFASDDDADIFLDYRAFDHHH
jgi:hypothetical protein